MLRFANFAQARSAFTNRVGVLALKREAIIPLADRNGWGGNGDLVDS